MADERNSFGTNLLIFLAGAAVGAAVVALTTPKTGPQLRSDLKGAGERLRDRFQGCCERAEETEAVPPA